MSDLAGPWRGGRRGASVPGGRCPARALRVVPHGGEGGQELAVLKYNYSQSDRPVQYSIDRFTLATWSPTLPEAPLPHGVSLVLKAHLPPLPAGLLGPKRGRAPCFG